MTAARIAGRGLISGLWRSARHRVVHSDRPSVFCNSVHKGTHLLVALAAGVPPFRAYRGRTYWHAVSRSRVDESRRKSPDDVVRDLGRALPGEILRGHVEYHPRIAEAFSEGWRHMLIVRDPRDAVVSLLHWWKRHEEIDAWPFRLFRRLSDDQDRLRFLIEGWDSDLVPPDWPRDVDFPDVGRRFEAYAGWVRDPACMVVRFEDLIREETSVEARMRITRHLRPDLDGSALERVLERMEESADPERSKTFRRGKTGGWRRPLDGALAERFERLAGPLVAELGYGPEGPL